MTITHACPPDGSGIMECCGRTPFEVSMSDRMTEDSVLVTCGKPRLIRRERTLGWRKAQVAADLGISPDDIVYIGRPGPWANPYDWRAYGRKDATLAFRYWLKGQFKGDFPKGQQWILDNAHTLRGKVLMCWCGDWHGEEPPPDCHGVPLWRLANEVKP